MHTNTSYRAYQSSGVDSSGVIVDLSEHIEAILNYEDVSGLLSLDQEARIVDFVRACLSMSYQTMKRRHSHWQEADRAHDVYVPPDTTSFAEKAVISDTRAVADTVLTYLMSALTGRNPMFMLEGTDAKSRRSAHILERVLHQQTRRGAGEAKIAQLLLDSVKYGFAPTKINWDAKNNTNQTINFDPRRAFPDPRVNWGDWEQMQFCTFVTFSSYDALLRTGLYPKLKQFPGLRQKQMGDASGWEAHRFIKEEGRGLSINPIDQTRTAATSGYFALEPARPVDEMWFHLQGYQIGVPQLDDIWLLAAIIDESVCIRLQLNPYGRQIPSVFGALHNDLHKTLGQSLYDIILPMHDIATWLLRSRVDNVQAALNNLIFADPTQVSIPDLMDRNAHGIVRTMPGVKAGEGFHVSQIPDVTRGHWNDIGALGERKQRVAAASDSQQGMPTSDGIRTATEIQRLSAMGGQRLGVLSRIVSALTIRPMVRMKVANIQDHLFNGSLRIVGDDVPPELMAMAQDSYVDFGTNDLQGNIEYLVIDGSLPTEPTRSPETWMSILQAGNQAGLGMELDMKQIALEGIRSMGVPDIERFRISPQQMAEGPSPSQQLQIMEKMRGASVKPNEQVQQEIQKGNLIPAQ